MQTDNINTPTVQSIISRAEDHIFDMTGMSIKLSIEPKGTEIGYLPTLGRQLTEIWGIDEATLRKKSRERIYCTYRQIFCLLARQAPICCTYPSIAEYLHLGDHTTVMSSHRVAKVFLRVNDTLFMKYFEPVKHLYNADFN